MSPMKQYCIIFMTKKNVLIVSCDNGLGHIKRSMIIGNELIKEGYVNNILISQDVFIKMMLKSYGGNGYTYILKYFKKRLKDIGVSDKDFNEIISENPKRVFS